MVPANLATALLVLLVLLAIVNPLLAQDKSIEEKTRVHRLSTSKRSVYDAFIYINRIPEKPLVGENAEGFAGRIFGRLANQEGRVLLKLPSGMNRQAYFGYKTFMRYEEATGATGVGNCAACHTPANFSDAKNHVVTAGGSARPTLSLRNLGKRGIDIRKVLLEKIAASRNRRSASDSDIAAAYGSMDIGEKDIPRLVAFLKLLDDGPDKDFRNLILNAKVMKQSVEEEPRPSLAGRVTFDGPRPEPKLISMRDKDGELSDCHQLHERGLLDEELLVGENSGIANVFVYVKKGYARKKHPAPTKPAVLDQVGCMFRPRVQGIMVGQDIVMKNGDPVLHNVRAISFRNRPFNVAQPAKSPDRTKVFKRKEKAVTIACDLHPWMKAYVFVMEHPWYAVTDAGGQFRIKDLPPGEYTLAAWHEELGEQDLEVTVTSTGPATANFAFKPKKSTAVAAKVTTITPHAQPPTKPAPLRAFVRKWKLADLAVDAAAVKDRSILRGREVFTNAGCIKCHVIAGQGTRYGPDLTDVTKRFSGAKLLKQILQPSNEIHREFQTQMFLTDAGKTVSGLVVKKTDTTIHVLPNPLTPRDVKVLQTSSIDERRKSDVSTMPEGLLDTFKRDEILDLLAFLQSGGK